MSRKKEIDKERKGSDKHIDKEIGEHQERQKKRERLSNKYIQTERNR